jgi:hypothetical protein
MQGLEAMKAAWNCYNAQRTIINKGHTEDDNKALSIIKNRCQGVTNGHNFYPTFLRKENEVYYITMLCPTLITLNQLPDIHEFQ